MPTFSATSAPPITIIEPSSGWAPVKLRELWEFREVLYFLVWRDIKVRYRQTLIGTAWAVIQPFLTMVVFTVFFGRLAKMPSDGLPYPLFAFAALVPWTFFANGLTQGTSASWPVATSSPRSTFPRLLVPMARVLGGWLDLVLALLMLLGMMWWYGVTPRPASLSGCPVSRCWRSSRPRRQPLAFRPQREVP